MPELPDIKLYLHALHQHFTGHQLKSVLIKSPFLLRTIDHGPQQLAWATVTRFSRVGKRIVWHLDNDLLLVFHLMIAGRFHLRKPGALPRGKNDLAAFSFPQGTLMLTEASSKKRASLHIVRAADGLAQFHRGGIDVTECSLAEFRRQLARCPRTLKRALGDPTIFDGIGNAYSDEILLEAGLSPFQRARQLDQAQTRRLYRAARSIIELWCDKLIADQGDRFPERITAFRPQMMAHGKFGQPCPKCSTRIQRVVYAENEMNYCPKCQTGGRILADRSLSRLLRDLWPKTIDELDDP